VRKLAVALIIFLIVTICFPMAANSIEIWPGSHTITIKKWYSHGDNINLPKIQVTNTESYDIAVGISLDNPSRKTITTGYSYIPKLSWIKTFPEEELFIPAGSSRDIEVSIEVPEDEQSSFYNERWETWVVVTSPPKERGGLNIRTEVGIKLFIITPVGEPAIIETIHIFLIALFLVILILIIIYYGEKKKQNAILYYFKKKK
jgi:hypothetical protein